MSVPNDHFFLLNQYPVNSNHFATSKRFLVSTLLFSLVFSGVIRLVDYINAPPPILSVYADQVFCPGALKVSSKNDFGFILNCSTSTQDNVHSSSVVIHKLSELDTNNYKVVAVLSGKATSDPDVIATLPNLAESEVLKAFVSNAMNLTGTDVLDSGSIYWGIGRSDKQDLGLVSALLDRGLSNPYSRFNDTIMKDLVKENQPSRSIKTTPDLSITKNTDEKHALDDQNISVEQGLSVSSNCSTQESEPALCQMNDELIKILEGPLAKIMMMLLIVTAIYSTIVSPNLVLFASCIASVLFLANASTILSRLLG